MKFNKPLLRWTLWFFLGNSLLFGLIGLNYLSNIPWLDTLYFSPFKKGVLDTFLTFAFVGQLGLLGLLASSSILGLVLLGLPRRYIFPIAIGLATALCTLLLIDTVTYKLYHFHLSGVIVALALHGFGEDVFGFSALEYVLCFSFIAFLLIVESLYAWVLWRYLLQNTFFKTSLKWVVVGIGMSLYFSYGMIIYSKGYVLHRVFVDVGHVPPFYAEIFTAILPSKGAKMEVARLAESNLTQANKVNAPLIYPLHPIHTNAMGKKLNVVMIVIDAWRLDMLNARVMPTMTKFAAKSLVFSNHVSGGNATGPGIFSLFYGLPVSYWTAMEAQHRGPILIDELIKQHYQMGIFSSAGIYLPAFYRTVFQAIKVKSLTPQVGKNPYARDKVVTKKFIEFLKRSSGTKQPFFSFLFYDAAHSYCAFEEDSHPFTPVVKHCNRLELTNQSDPMPYFNRYKNALALLDQQLNDVFTALANQHLLENTLVIITGDHGEEFNDNHVGFWGHASNFTHYQIATPLVIYWPDKKPAIYSYKTSHFDVAPTLLQAVLGVNNVPEDYSLGRNLFQPEGARPYLIISSYTNFGVVEADRITNVSSVGSYDIEQMNGSSSPSLKINDRTFHLVFQDLRRFFKK